eukprot:1523567-Alexandrium_andersonii.AAC.1
MCASVAAPLGAPCAAGLACATAPVCVERGLPKAAPESGQLKAVPVHALLVQRAPGSAPGLAVSTPVTGTAGPTAARRG